MTADAFFVWGFWFAAGFVWLVSALIAGRSAKSHWMAPWALVLTVVLGPCGIVAFIYWCWANFGPSAPPTPEDKSRALERRLGYLRAQWNDDTITMPELLEFSRLLDEERRTDESLAVLDHAVDLDPLNSDLWRQKARLHWRLGQRHEEELAYQNAEALARKPQL